MKRRHVLNWIICGVLLGLCILPLIKYSRQDGTLSPSLWLSVSLETLGLDASLSTTETSHPAALLLQESNAVHPTNHDGGTRTTRHPSFRVIDIPANGPDERIATRAMAAWNHNDMNTTTAASSAFNMSQAWEQCGGATAQVRLVVPTNDALWSLQALNAQGHVKKGGGDEFYVTFTSASQGPWYKNRQMWDQEPLHPTATAFVVRNDDGAYTLDFVTSPMAPAGIDNNVKNDDRKDDRGGNLTIHWIYTCGMGEMPPPTKDGWTQGGAIQVVHSMTLDSSPPMRPFVPPSPTQQSSIDLAAFDHILMIGDSVMGQFAAHQRQPFRPHISKVSHAQALTTQSVSGFVRTAKQAIQNLAMTTTRLGRKDSKNGTTKLAVVLGSSTWDILEDIPGQGRDFADHGLAVRTYLQQVRKILDGTWPGPATLVWKSATAVHAHVVVDRRTKWFGPPAKALKRIKYMSSFRSDTIYSVQKRIIEELGIPMLDIYNASYLSGDWHYPTDGRHFRPEFNQMTLNWFYTTKPPDDVRLDYRFGGTEYGVVLPKIPVTSLDDIALKGHSA